MTAKEFVEEYSRESRAKKDFRKARELDPDNPLYQGQEIYISPRLIIIVVAVIIILIVAVKFLGRDREIEEYQSGDREMKEPQRRDREMKESHTAKQIS